MCAAPGPSRRVVVERHGHLGLPPVFTVVERLSVVEVEAASAIQVRLYAGQSLPARSTPRATRRGRAATARATRGATLTLGSWPNGNPFPLSHDRLGAQRRQRSVRRWASGLIFLDGLVNVAVTVSPPLRSRLHTVHIVLPLGVAQSAAALTAVAGIAHDHDGARASDAVSAARGSSPCAALAVTIVAHLARGGTSSASLIAARPCSPLLVIEREHFQATTDRTSLTRGHCPAWASSPRSPCWRRSLGIEASGVHRHLPAFGVVLRGLRRAIGRA